MVIAMLYFAVPPFPSLTIIDTLSPSASVPSGSTLSITPVLKTSERSFSEVIWSGAFPIVTTLEEITSLFRKITFA